MRESDVVEFHKSKKLWILVLISVFILAAWYDLFGIKSRSLELIRLLSSSRSSKTRRCSKEVTDTEQKPIKVIRVLLSPGKWSKWNNVDIPGCRWKFTCNPPVDGLKVQFKGERPIILKKTDWKKFGSKKPLMRFYSPQEAVVRIEFYMTP